MSTYPEDLALAQQHLDALGEHFDTVQIFCSRHEAGESEGGTINVTVGSGNTFARYGQISLWIVAQAGDYTEGITDLPA